MRRYPPLTFLALALPLIACSSALTPFELRELFQAEQRWKSHNIQNYAYEMRTSCFCPPEIVEWAVVEVRDDKVVSARSLTGTALTGFSLASRKTVTQLFDAAHGPYAEWVGRVDFEFDDELGYPTRVNLEGKPNIADAGTLYEARNLRVTPP